MKIKFFIKKTATILFWLLPVISYSIFSYFDLRINLSSSMPIGVYQKSKDQTIYRGSLVSVCLRAPIAKVGLARGYLHRGSCSSGASPIVKRVIGVPGDVVTLSEDLTTVRNKSYVTVLQRFDRNGHFLQSIELGEYVLSRKQYWLYGDKTLHISWDSRYFGSVSLEKIKGVYKKRLVF